jgi:hypothetical protein
VQFGNCAATVILNVDKSDTASITSLEQEVSFGHESCPRSLAFRVRMGMHINLEQNSVHRRYSEPGKPDLGITLQTGQSVELSVLADGFRQTIQDRAKIVRPPETDRKSFNHLSYVNMMRFDLQRYGSVLPETREQVGNEFLSHICEAVDRSSKTDFVLRNDADGLKYFKNGEWTSYASMLDTGLEVAKLEAAVDPRRDFLFEWAKKNKEQGNRMAALKPGEQFTWDSRYPEDVEHKYGSEFLQNCGLQPERKMGFLYKAKALNNGYILLESQTVDRSDDTAFDAAQLASQEDSAINLDKQVKIYDSILEQKQGGRFRAGRRDIERRDNAWDKIREHKDLIDYGLDEFERIARSSLDGLELENYTKEHIYGVWALFSKRLNGEIQSISSYAKHEVIDGSILQEIRAQVNYAFQDFAREGKPMVGCGGDITISKGEKDVFAMRSEDIFASIFSSSERYDFDVDMFCVKCQAPPTQDEIEHNKTKKCGPCGLCKPCDVDARLNQGSELVAG